MERFLRYSLEHHRKIRVIFQQEFGFLQKNMEVLGYDDEQVRFRAGHGKTMALPLTEILACSYARGDNGGEDE